MPEEREGTAIDHVHGRPARPAALPIVIVICFLIQGCAATPRGPAAGGRKGSLSAGILRPGPRGAEGEGGGRPIRVLVEEVPREAVLEGDTVRAFRPDGTPAAEASGAMRLVAVGSSIRRDGAFEIGSPVDVTGSPGLRLGGRRLPGRLRIAARQGTLLLIAVVPLEDYVRCVVAKESPPSFRDEALKAIAVAARTYARVALSKPRDRDYDVVATVEDQVFEPADSLPETVAGAVDATRGEVLTHGGAPARVAYHSTCGGKTESSAGAWGGDVPYLRSIPCEDCRESPVWRWQYRMSGRDGRRIARALGVKAGRALKIDVTGRTPSGRAARVMLSSDGVSREMKAASFRKAAGYANVRSLSFQLRPLGDGWLLLGEGYGHGVGLCQWGAEGMARSGKSYREILSRYYPKTVLAAEGF